jgi:rRNA-processing protein FCF1
LPIKVILDSSFLLTPPEFHVNLSEELEKVLNRKVEAIILSPVYEELKRIYEEKRPKEGKKALMALEFIEEFDIVDVKKQRNEAVDDVIIRLAGEWKCPVATNDRGLRRRLRDIGVAVVYLRQKSHLEVKGVIG